MRGKASEVGIEDAGLESPEWSRRSVAEVDVEGITATASRIPRGVYRGIERFQKVKLNSAV